MPHADLPRYQEGFFQKFLAELPGSPARAALEQRQPANTPLSLLGEYVRYSGAAITPIPKSRSNAAGPNPESCNSCGELKAPPASITSQRVLTERFRP